MGYWRNGAGKSTTMRMIAGLLAPQAGQVRIFGQTLTPCEANPALGTLIENPGLYPNLSAFDNLMTKALVLGVVNAPQRCRELLNLVGLDESKKRVKAFQWVCAKGLVLPWHCLETLKSSFWMSH